MQVALIRPARLSSKSRPTAFGKPVPPLGLAYLAGALRVAGHAVTCIDAAGEAMDSLRSCAGDPDLLENGLSAREIVARIPTDARVIGITCMFSFEWPHLVGLIQAIRSRFPGSFLVIGGEQATADHEYILRTTPEVDACVLGEGENKLLGLVQALEEGVSKLELPGVAVLDRETGNVRKNDELAGHHRIQDVDSIPRPAWDLLPIQAYLDSLHGCGSRGVRAIPMLASRGCPHRCTFCSSPQMWGTRWKARAVDDVIDEIKTYIRLYQIDQVEFFDLTAIIDKRWIQEFSQRLIDEKLGITWAMPSGTRTEALSEEVLDLLKRSGCSKLTYPFETGSAKTNALIKKKIVYERSLASLKQAVKSGLIVKSTTILGFPFHTFRDVLREYAFAIRLAWLGTHDHVFFSFAPYPGSELHDQLVAQGTIVKDGSYPEFLKKSFYGNFANARSWCPNFSGRTLLILCLVGFALYYGAQYLFRPHRLVASVFRVFTGNPLTNLELTAVVSAKRAFSRRPIRLLTTGDLRNQ